MNRPHCLLLSHDKNSPILQSVTLALHRNTWFSFQADLFGPHIETYKNVWHVSNSACLVCFLLIHETKRRLLLWNGASFEGKKNKNLVPPGVGKILGNPFVYVSGEHPDSGIITCLFKWYLWLFLGFWRGLGEVSSSGGGGSQRLKTLNGVGMIISHA